MQVSSNETRLALAIALPLAALTLVCVAAAALFCFRRRRRKAQLPASGPSDSKHSANHGSVSSSASLEPYKHLEAADAATPNRNASYHVHSDSQDDSTQVADQAAGTRNAIAADSTASSADSGRLLQACTPAGSELAAATASATERSSCSGAAYLPARQTPTTTGSMAGMLHTSLNAESGRVSRTLGPPSSEALPGGTLNPATLPQRAEQHAQHSAVTGDTLNLPAEHPGPVIHGIDGTLNPRTMTLVPPAQQARAGPVLTPPLSVGSGYLTSMSRTIHKPSQLVSMASSAQGPMYDSAQMADGAPAPLRSSAPAGAGADAAPAQEPNTAELSASRITPSTMNKAHDGELPPGTRIVPPGEGNTDVTVGGFTIATVATDIKSGGRESLVSALDSLALAQPPRLFAERFALLPQRREGTQARRRCLCYCLV